MSARKIVACLVVMLGVAVGSSIGMASPWNRATYFTFNKPIRLPGVSLPPGTYLFELPSANTANLVRVSNRTGTKVYLTAFTRLVRRPTSGQLKPAIVFGEGSATAPTPINVWYPDGDPTGREFIY